MNFSYTRPYPIRWRPSSGGVKALAAGGSDIYSGSYARTPRAFFLITNRSATDALDVCNAYGIIMDTIWPQTSIMLPCEEDLIVKNNSANPINYVVSEAFFSSAPVQSGAGSKAGGGGSGAPGGSGGGGSGGDGGGGGTYLN
jgi:hypothetical protein